MQSLINITIPEKVTNIGDYAFTDCKSLVSLVIPNSVKIGYRAFENCSALETITIPNSVTSILESALTVVKISQLWVTKILLLKNYAKENEINFIELIKNYHRWCRRKRNCRYKWCYIFTKTYCRKQNTDELPLIDESNKDVFESVDLNKDGKLDVQDVTLLQQLVAGNKE